MSCNPRQWADAGPDRQTPGGSVRQERAGRWVQCSSTPPLLGMPFGIAPPVGGGVAWNGRTTMTTRRTYSPAERALIKRGQLEEAKARNATRHKRPIQKRVPGGTRGQRA